MISLSSVGSSASRCSSQRSFVAQTQVVGFSPSSSDDETGHCDSSLSMHSNANGDNAISHTSHVSWISIGINRHVRSTNNQGGNTDPETCSDSGSDTLSTLHAGSSQMIHTTNSSNSSHGNNQFIPQLKSRRRRLAVFPSAIPALALDTASMSDTTDSDLGSDTDTADDQNNHAAQVAARLFPSPPSSSMLESCSASKQPYTQCVSSKPICVRLTLSQQRNLSVHTSQRRVVCAHLNAEFTRPLTGGVRRVKGL
ncbi:hypothetical protein BASA50_000463 [Batrachochytrium salamandrivorans]|uniref:Uncharacterized protein n=1 Tax=Batrachochytrium salamandrivorans TaxID=1357716 RepID=A0ABQ8ETU3_9FUNG|nr:hypothetical protein BASA62_005015 [Batrachochytrium salamandrivorans]KAH6572673.1 hypothetical protein BASA60_006484 [Batrachochytrium salamandrivorans]KAH6586509.1 hypothetical protein BASA50_000463 [Batrachochytrium salamandrivorans]KAH9275425.1 hypothetical protein BASA83_002198 [Batrachochytrium salamandrivorans]